MFTDKIKELGGRDGVVASQVLKKQTLRGTELVDNTAAAFQSQLRTSDFHEDAVESSELHFRAVCSVEKPSACHDFFFFFFADKFALTSECVVATSYTHSLTINQLERITEPLPGLQ